MRKYGAIACVAALAAGTSGAFANVFQITEVRAIVARPPTPYAIAFVDRYDDKFADPATGFIPFEHWAQSFPVQRRFLSPYPGYVEQADATVASTGKAPASDDKLHMYVAEARFAVAKSPESIDLARYATITFLERVDPAIKHRVISAAEADNTSNKNPGRRWCETTTKAVCIQSRYQLEGKLPMGIQLVNHLRDGKKKIPDYLEFQSELRVLQPSDRDEPGLIKLTERDAPIVGVLEQNIFYVNQVMQFGKFLAVLQRDPANPNNTVVTAFIALAVNAKIFQKQKKYENVPVLRNLVPAQVLVGKSSFNTGNSISAGLPSYARNKIKSVAGMLERE
jgi:hypothetical protein